MSTLELKAKKADLFEAISMINDEEIINNLFNTLTLLLNNRHEEMESEQRILHKGVEYGFAQFKAGEHQVMTSNEAKQLLGL